MSAGSRFFEFAWLTLDNWFENGYDESRAGR